MSKTLIRPDRKGSRTARTAGATLLVLSIVMFAAAALCFVIQEMAYVATLIIGAISVLLLRVIVRLLGWIAYDLETIAATKELEYTEDPLQAVDE